jgi:hypothetical protein
MKKLFEVSIEKTVYVLAEDEREAEREAKTYEDEVDGDVLSCNEILDPVRVPNEWMDAIPFGDNPDDLTVKQILEQPLPPVPYVDPPEQLRIDFQGGAQPA